MLAYQELGKGVAGGWRPGGIRIVASDTTPTMGAAGCPFLCGGGDRWGSDAADVAQTQYDAFLHRSFED